MANTLAPVGFRPVGRLGAPGAFQTEFVQIAYNLSNKIGYGDPVKLLSTGLIDVMAVGGSSISGVFLGCEYYDPNTGRYEYKPAWTAPSGLASTQKVVAHIVNDPFALFQVQSTATAIAQSDIGKNIDITTGTSGAPNSLSGISTCSVDQSTVNTTNTLPFKLIGIVGLETGTAVPCVTPTYDPTLGNNWVTVSFNTNALLQTTGI